MNPVSLNRSQRKAARPDGGVTLVIAGAGTGKTKTLVEKISNILTAGEIRPENMLVLTFSRKAAGEIVHRVKSVVGDSADRLTTGTFHSFCLRFLREYGEIFMRMNEFGSFPSVMDDERREKLIRELIHASLPDFMGLPEGVIYSLMMDLDKLPLKMLKKLSRLDIIPKLKKLEDSFKIYKKENNVIDFEDMIGFTIDLLEKNEEIRLESVRKYRYILVDEFQDTSRNNFEFLKLLLPESPNLFVVGDDWQSIYGFRDSRIEYIIRMKKYFPSVKTCKLNVNYRSHREIVRISSAFIRKNRYRTGKRLKSFKGKGGKVTGIAVLSRPAEIDEIKRILEIESGKSGELAILYRNNWQGEIIKNHLGQSGDRVQLMTMHSSKGLEFETVIIAGVADAILPDVYSDIEEERRLMYVAMTRAKKKLYIIYHMKNNRQIPVFAGELGFSPAKSLN